MTQQQQKKIIILFQADNWSIIPNTYLYHYTFLYINNKIYKIQQMYLFFTFLKFFNEYKRNKNNPYKSGCVISLAYSNW